MHFRIFLFGMVAMTGQAAEVTVDSHESLVAALRAAGPGTTIRVAPGTYRGGHHLAGLSGTAAAPIVIEAADEANPPLFSAEQGGSEAFHLSGCSHVTLRRLRVSGFPANGINADDGGAAGTGSEGLRFERLSIENTGPTGNHDALKLSGLDRFAVTDCHLAGWGGSGIDLVGCHEGTIAGCVFEGRPGFSQDNGVQLKGGTSRVTVRDCFFNQPGQRGINLGGSTGLAYFRPADATWEARDIEVTGNRFVGSLAPIVWVGCENGRVVGNTFHLPEKWVVRILQENTAARFGRCRGGRFERNLILFDRRVRVFANIGPGTEPESFVFARNAWFCVDEAGRGPRDLPVAETDAVIGVDPVLREPGTAKMAVGSTDPRLRGIGAGAAAE